MVDLKFLQRHRHYILQPKITTIYAIVKNDVFVAKICKYALSESSEGFCCGTRKPANPCHPGAPFPNFDEKYILNSDTDMFLNSDKCISKF